jgi:hypothetical protein
MSGLSKRDAAALVASVRSANVAGHAIAIRTSGGNSTAMAAFLGGLESVLEHFLRSHGCHEAAASLSAAMNDVPAEAEIAARNARIDSYRNLVQVSP